MKGTAEQVVQDLVSAGLLDRTRTLEARSVVSRSLVGAQPGPAPAAIRPPREMRTLLVEISAYVGGALVIAAVGLFLAQTWESFSDAARVATLAVVAVLLGLSGVVLSHIAGGSVEAREGEDEVRRRLTSTLLTAASLAGALAVGLQVSIGFDSDADWPGFIGAATMVVLGVASYVYMPSGLGVAVIAAAGFQSVMTAWTIADPAQDTSLWTGLVLVVLGALWLGATEARWFREVSIARLLGVAATIIGAQVTMIDGSRANLAYALTALAAAAGFTMYVRTAAWPYLLGGVGATTLVVTEAVIDWTEGALGPAGGVLIAGLTLLAASVAGFRVRRDVTGGISASDPGHGVEGTPTTADRH